MCYSLEKINNGRYKNYNTGSQGESVRSKARDKDCRCGYLEEKELVKQFETLLDNIELDENEIKNKINAFVSKVRDFNSFLYGEKTNIDINKIDTKNYVRFILKKGKDDEKRDILVSFKNKIILKGKEISIS